MSILSRLFGAKSEGKDIDPVEHNGYRIFADPISEGSGYRIAARIEKEHDGAVKVHQMIRADTYSGQDTAVDASVAKAKQVIDQLGDSIFS